MTKWLKEKGSLWWISIAPVLFPSFRQKYANNFFVLEFQLIAIILARKKYANNFFGLEFQLRVVGEREREREREKFKIFISFIENVDEILNKKWQKQDMPI